MKKQFVDEWLKRDWYVREENAKGDLDVIDEVVTRDMYGMKAYAQWHKEPSLILDIGAHIGTFTVLAKELWPNVRIIAFEPNPSSFQLFVANTRDFFGVTRVNGAISYGVRPDLVYVDSLKSTGSGFVIERDKAENAIGWKDSADHMGYEISDIPIQVGTVEEHLFLADPKFPCQILIKLDAELAEVNILNGMSPELASNVVGIVGEYHCQGGWGEFLQTVDIHKFPSLEFKCLAENENNPIGLFRAI